MCHKFHSAFYSFYLPLFYSLYSQNNLWYKLNFTVLIFFSSFSFTIIDINLCSLACLLCIVKMLSWQSRLLSPDFISSSHYLVILYCQRSLMGLRLCVLLKTNSDYLQTSKYGALYLLLDNNGSFFGPHQHRQHHL